MGTCLTSLPRCWFACQHVKVFPGTPRRSQGLEQFESVWFYLKHHLGPACLHLLITTVCSCQYGKLLLPFHTNALLSQRAAQCVCNACYHLQAQEQVKQLEIRRALDAEGWLSDVTILRKQLAAVDRKLHQMRLMDRLQVGHPTITMLLGFGALHEASASCRYLHRLAGAPA